MKNKFIKSLILLTLVTGSSFYLNGCMMAGMGMMHGGGNHGMDMEEHNMSNVIIKEYSTSQYKIITEFPTMIMSNSDACRVKIYNKTTGTLQPDAEVYLEILADAADKDSSANSSTLRIKYMKYENGYFVFNPSFSSAGSYRLIFSIERIGTEIFKPPIEIEHAIDNQSEMNHDHNRSSSGSILSSPYLYVGAAAMAIMMIFVIR
ncbi:MAG: hypothetical protein M1495_14810 [Bacteroidetes bacterium]|nr:hypothetical protein [Bacteroidota bacterium]